jgi:enoyl-CoA hydratase/carnithine racemase
MSSYETLLYEERDHVAWVTLNRPESANAFNAQMQEELRSVWRGLRSNDDVRVVVLTAAGDKAFCVGVDRDEPFVALVADTLYGTSNNFMYDDPGDFLGPKACDLWKPVICAVNGMACGGAFYMLAECDVIVAAEHATFFDPHVTYGLAAVYEPIKMLQRMPLGEVLRMSLVGSHERISAATAMRMGLVSEVVPAEELGAAAGRLAEIIASQPPIAVQGTLRAIWAGNDLPRHQALSIAPAILSTATDTRLMAEGVDSFSSGMRVKPRVR